MTSSKIHFLGRVVDPLARTEVNAALGDARRLMASPAYTDGNDPFHQATVARVQQLFEIAHAGNTDRPARTPEEI